MSAVRFVAALFVVLDQGEDVEAGEFFAAVEEGEFDGEGEAFDFAAEFLDELGCGRGGAAGGEQVVADDDAVAGGDGVFVDFDRVGAVFEGVGDGARFGGQFFRLSNGDEAGAESIGESGSENKATSFDAGDLIDLVAVVVPAELID